MPTGDFSHSPAQRQRAAQAVAVDEFLDDLIEENVHAQRPQSASQAQSATHTGLITKFQELADRGMVSKVVIDTITRQMGLETMTEVQSMTINKMLKGADTVAQARTGTGKTLAFLIPLLQNIISVDPSLERPSRHGYRRGPDIRAIIISPTRELAQQIATEAEKVVRNTGVVVQTAVGGSMKREGLRKIQTQGCHILVATPGRLYDVLGDERFGIKAPNLSALVLDEADRLLDEGFYEKIVDIQKLLPDRRSMDRQTLLFSATIPKGIMNVVNQTMKPQFQFVQTVQEGEIATHERVAQKFVDLQGMENVIPALFELFQRELARDDGPPFKAIVYFNTTTEAILTAEIFRNLVRPADGSRPLGSARLIEIHGRLTQPKRTFAAEGFRRAERGILFSSDVTARGMDFPNVTHVIQVGYPVEAETYVHRIGRTARGDKTGEGWLFRLPFERYSRTLSKFPLKPDTSLETAQVDMTQDANLPQHVAKILTQVTEATQLVPASIKTTAYISSLGGLNSSYPKNEVVRALNDRAKYGWGSEPPKVSPSLVQRLGMSKVSGINIGYQPREESDAAPREGYLPRGGDRGFSGGGFSRGDFPGYSRRSNDFSTREPSERRTNGFSKDRPSSEDYGSGGFSRDRPASGNYGGGGFSRDRPSSGGYGGGNRTSRSSFGGSRNDRYSSGSSDESGPARSSYGDRGSSTRGRGSSKSGFGSPSSSKY
ncbi:MAG: hypothetical protein MMC33_004858 [Icmadophila ericetorum]|nr:hypothetical protein [Icmadophila ericetorum]